MKHNYLWQSFDYSVGSEHETHLDDHATSVLTIILKAMRFCEHIVVVMSFLFYVENKRCCIVMDNTHMKEIFERSYNEGQVGC